MNKQAIAYDFCFLKEFKVLIMSVVDLNVNWFFP